MEDVFSTVYSDYIPEERKTYQGISRRGKRDVGGLHLLQVPLKKTEFRKLFSDRVVRAFIVTIELPDGQREFVFGVVGKRNRVSFYANTSNADNSTYKVRNTPAATVSRSVMLEAEVYRDLQEDFTQASQAIDDLSDNPNRTSVIVNIEVDLKSKREVLLARCEQFDIDARLITKVLTDEVQHAIDTMNDLSLACYALVNAKCLDVEHELLAKMVKGSGRNLGRSIYTIYTIDMDEVKRILFECHEKVLENILLRQ